MKPFLFSIAAGLRRIGYLDAAMIAARIGWRLSLFIDDDGRAGWLRS
ncbi:MAG TPA: hypothetical protein VM425_06355 [Myxococcota bacterium]|nr:hypothetical protein [Myxococcota bacterium]